MKEWFLRTRGPNSMEADSSELDICRIVSSILLPEEATYYTLRMVHSDADSDSETCSHRRPGQGARARRDAARAASAAQRQQHYNLLHGPPPPPPRP